MFGSPSSWIVADAIAVNAAHGKELLVQAIKAEYRHFSSPPGFFVHPSARPLRKYFAELTQVLEKEHK